jgi:23S rRNA (adenine2503-C2)-methyltransferase
MMKTNILDYTPKAFAETFIARFHEPSFRAAQIFEQIYKHGIADWGKMAVLPKNLRDVLAATFSLKFPAISLKRVSRDGTIKYLFALDEKVSVESVLIREDKRSTVCFSTQAGCPVECSFCATGKGGFIRNLTTAEIVGQVLAIERDTKMRVTNCVAMGQGEPLLNREAVLTALHILNDPQCTGISARRLALSTVGIVPGILALAEEPLPIKLAVSLHTARQSVREKLIPVSKKYPLTELKKALRHYVDKTKNRITFEYILIEGINDDKADAEALGEYSRGLPVYINLIPWNVIPGLDFKNPTAAKVEEFASVLRSSGLEVFIRKGKGEDIQAACGQLTQQFFNA